MQSESFDLLYKSDEDVVVSAPTASGKTTLMDLAILRLVEQGGGTIVYLAPLKALCQERKKDWSERFRRIGLKCAEVTGDSDQLNEKPDLILATPEKWDSVTRKSRVKVSLLLVDEVHTLSQPVRGATLEAVVSRMKTLSSRKVVPPLRIVAISATIPNVCQVAEWLGARVLVFDSSYRPVPLSVKVMGYCPAKSPFHFEQNLNYRLPEVVANYSDNKPTLVFCQTQKGTVKAALHLAQDTTYIRSKDQAERLRLAFRSVSERALQETAIKGVGFHHGGLSPEDREVVERLFLSGDLLVLCTTTTLAVGVNLPAHLVVVKSTMGYRGSSEGYSEYSSLELLQMLGRAGRPQFDTRGVAVIMTEKHKVKHYEDLAEAREHVGSSLGESMIEHLNAEVALGTVTSREEAQTWLESTFFYVCSRETSDLVSLCSEHLGTLLELHLVAQTHSHYQATALGKALAYNCVAVATVVHFAKNLTPSADLLQLLLLISGAAEFEQFSSKMDQRKELKRLNSAPEVRSKLKGAISSAEKKVFLLLQVSLGRVAIESWDLKQQLTSILTTSRRVVAVLHEFCDFKGYGRCLMNALVLNKVLVQCMWPDETEVLRQLSGIGDKASTLLRAAQITSFDHVLNSEPWRLEAVCNKNPPFGSNLKASVQRLPQFSLSLLQDGKDLEIIGTSQAPPQAEESKGYLLALGKHDKVLCYRRLTLSSSSISQRFRCDSTDLPVEVHLISATYSKA
jgi:ATP-dependent DNA helicase HFM1/MER3